MKAALVLSLLLCLTAFASAACVSGYTQPPPNGVSTKVMEKCMSLVDRLDGDFKTHKACAASCRNFLIAQEMPLCNQQQQSLRPCRSECEKFKAACLLEDSFDCSALPEDNCNSGPLNEQPHRVVSKVQSDPIGYDALPWTHPIVGGTTPGSWCVHRDGRRHCTKADFEAIFMCYQYLPPTGGVSCSEFDYVDNTCLLGNFVDTHVQNRTSCQILRWEGLQMVSAGHVRGWQCNSGGGAVIPCRSFSDSEDKCRLVQILDPSDLGFSASSLFGRKASSECRGLYGAWKEKYGGADDTAFSLF